MVSQLKFPRFFMGPFIAASFLVATFIAPRAFAYYSTIDNGEVITPGTYQVGLEPQWITNRYEGFQDTVRFDAGIDESSSARVLLGGGPVDLEIGGFYKWVPFPDIDNQPAIGGDLGLIISHVSQRGQAGNEVSLRFHPMISKRLESEIGDFIPYGALPLGLTVRPDGVVVPIQLAGGLEFRPLGLRNLSGFVEIGVDMLNAFGYVSVAAAWRFDDSMIRPRRRK